MSNRQNIPSRPDPSRAEILLARLFLLIALGTSTYLAWNSLRGGGVPGCGPESDCDKVLSSRWAYLFGMPVSLAALPVYGGLLALWSLPKRRWPLLLPGAWLLIGAAIWFVGLQAFVLQAFCKFCLTAHLAGALAGWIILRRNPLEFRRTILAAAGAAAAVAVLAGAQWAGAPPGPVSVGSRSLSATEPPAATPAVSATLSTSTQPAAVAAVAAPVSPPPTAAPAPAAPAAPAVPTFTFVDGQVTLSLHEVPVTGLISAPKKAVKLFDYTCHHCRDLHHLLKPVLQTHAQTLAIISLPVPLSSECNSVVRKTAPDHQDACAFARLGLAVFLAKPDQFEVFTDWVFEPKRPPEVSAAQQKAESLVGEKQLAAALADPRIEQQIQRDVNIYVASSRLARKGAMPQLLFSRGGSIGAVPSAAQLDKILSDHLGLSPASAPPQ